MHAGISWDEIGYRVAVVDLAGRPVLPERRFRASEFAPMVDLLRRNGGETVIDGTNGLLDGMLVDAGITVYRAAVREPGDRPLLGSVPARELAREAVDGRAFLTRLEAGAGTHAGRDKEISDGFQAGVSAVESLPGPGGFVAHGRRDDHRVALTFDDGPLPPYTGRILDVLERYGVPATFFCAGLQAVAHPGQVRRIHEQGSALGNHTWSHPLPSDLSAPQLAEQLRRTDEVLADAVNGAPPLLFRPPYGALPPGPCTWPDSPEVTTVFWDVDSKDWSMPGTDILARTVLDRVRPGSIVLMHDGGGVRSQTVDALPTVIETLLARGYRLVRVDDLLGIAPAPAEKPRQR